ncbi:MAG TPA: class I SAM-dependent methyltransferase [Gaiellaceae bacterium]
MRNDNWWATGFAFIYEPTLWLGEHFGMRRHRRALLAEARGRVLEIGAGTGLNLAHYPADVDELILTEPDASMHRRLLRRSDGPAKVVAAPAERLPVPDGSVDTVVSTFVLCTVDDPEATLREIRRVLRPDGQLLLIEHVRSGTRVLATLQRLLRRPWAGFARGCRCDQDTPGILEACGFRSDLRPARWRGVPPLVAPLVVGRAVIA